MTCAEALRFLLDLLDGTRYPRPPGREANLIRVGRLLARLGHPERDLATVLVAGTKGKGSTAAMLAAIEEAAGRHVGVYTKPHLVEYRERVRVGGRVIGEDELAALVAQVRPAVEAGTGDPQGAATYFEASVAVALLHFHRRRVDLAVLEVGLGGRLDATNACDPLLSVITPISYDHMEVLGRTLGAIAQEKVGIIRAGRPLVIAPQPPEAEEALRLACARVGASLVRVAGRARWDSRAMNAQGQTLHLRGARDYGAIHLPLVGRHQALNVATMQALRDALLEVWPGRRLILVFGMVATHDHEGPAAVIAPLADVVIITRPEHVHPLPPAVLADAVRPYAPQVEVEEDRAAAVARALDAAGPADVVCVTGSFYLAGEARARLLASQEVAVLGAKEPSAASSLNTGSSPDSGL